MGVTPWVTMTRRRNGRVSVRLGRLPRGYRLVETVEHRRGDEEVGAEGFGHRSACSRDVCGHTVGDPAGRDEPGRHHDPAGAGRAQLLDTVGHRGLRAGGVSHRDPRPPIGQGIGQRGGAGVRGGMRGADRDHEKVCLGVVGVGFSHPLQ